MDQDENYVVLEVVCYLAVVAYVGTLIACFLKYL